MSIKTHTFKGTKYDIDEVYAIEGVTDTPGKPEHLCMSVLDGNDLSSLHSHLHEGLHAMGIPDEYIHDKDGCYTTMDLARFLWRMGWRRKRR